MTDAALGAVEARRREPAWSPVARIHAAEAIAALRIVRASQVRELQVSRVIARDLPAHVRGPELVRYVTRDLAHMLADELVAKVPIVWQPPHETPDHETRATVRLHVIKPRAEK